jgi:hypothetical protein
VGIAASQCKGDGGVAQSARTELQFAFPLDSETKRIVCGISIEQPRRPVPACISREELIMKRTLLIGALLMSGLLAFGNLSLAQSAAPDAAAPAVDDAPVPQVPLPAGMTPIFDGKTLDGWIQEPLNATTFSGGDISDLPAFAKKLTEKADPVSAFLSDQLDDAAKKALADAPANDNAKELRSALAKNLTRIASGASLYDTARFSGVTLRPETSALLAKNPQGRDLLRLNRVLLEDAYPTELGPSPSASWTVKNGALASLGAGRGVIYTTGQYSRYRIIFDMRHVSGKPDHQACVLVFCTAPTAGEKPMDALGGIQFQVPNGGHWDYRKGHNNGGKEEFTAAVEPGRDPGRCRDWHGPDGRRSTSGRSGSGSAAVQGFNRRTKGTVCAADAQQGIV